MVTLTVEPSVDNHHKATWLSHKLTILVTSHESCVVNYGNTYMGLLRETTTTTQFLFHYNSGIFLGIITSTTENLRSKCEAELAKARKREADKRKAVEREEAALVTLYERCVVSGAVLGPAAAAGGYQKQHQGKTQSLKGSIASNSPNAPVP